MLLLQVSDFIGTFQHEEDEKYHLVILKYFQELNVVVCEYSTVGNMLPHGFTMGPWNLLLLLGPSEKQ